MTTPRLQPLSPDRAKRVAWGLSATATAVWAAAVAVSGTWSRVLDNWESALTMLFGSFLAGSSPEGGGAVAFPVFTKVLDVPGAVARTFGLSIQAVGMTMAVAAIVLYRRPIERTALAVAVPTAIAGFGVGLMAFANTSTAFWPATFAAGWVKATFSIVLATTSILMVRRLRRHETSADQVPWCREVGLIVAVAGFAGGVLSSLTGTGANIMIFLVLVVVVGLDPKRALPTAIAVMAAVSVVGIVVLGVADGQLDITVVDDRVTAVGSEPVDFGAGQADLLGLWLAAVPVVVWGAPLGSWAAARVNERMLVGFVAALAAIEVITTLLLVDDLRRNPAMITYMVVGLVALPALLVALASRRPRWRRAGS